MHKAADFLIKTLENEGVEYIFGLPGEENLDVLEAIRKSDIKFILTRHEQGAGFMAATYGRLTGKAGVVMATLGPGATNLMTAAAFAYLGAMPMVMLTTQKPISSNEQGEFQILDIVEMMRPVTKFAKQIMRAEKMPSLVREAFRLAQQEKQGPVHLEIPEDISQERIGSLKFYEVPIYEVPKAGPEAIEMATVIFKSARRPILLIGSVTKGEDMCGALLSFVDTLGVPFVTTQMGKGSIDERHELYLGTTALSENDFVHRALEEADLILNVGHDNVEKPPFLMRHDDLRKVIHLSLFPASVNEVYFPELNVVGAMAKSLADLTKSVGKLNRSWNLDFFHKTKLAIEEHNAGYIDDDRFPILPQRMVSILRNTCPEDGITTLDNGIYKIWFARNYRAYFEHSLILDNALATMGAGLPSAMVAKMLNPSKKVISINGDGGFMINSQELETAVRLGIDLVVIILNDNAYGMIKWKQRKMGFEDFGLDCPNPDFVTYAQSFGAKGHRPNSVDNFIRVLESALDSKGVHLIDLAVDYSLNQQVLNEEIKKLSNELTLG